MSQSDYLGGIVGIVVDPAGYGIPNAEITLWKCEYNAWTGQYHNLYNVTEYPMRTGDGRMSAIGQYAFSNLPTGLYNVTAEKNGYLGYTIVQVDEVNGTVPGNIVMNGYVTQLPPAPTPLISDMPSPSATPKASPGVSLFVAMFTLSVSCLIYCFIRKRKNE